MVKICSIWGFIAWFKQKCISLCVFHVCETQCTRTHVTDTTATPNGHQMAVVNVRSVYCMHLQMHVARLEPSHKSHNSLDKYPTMHHFVTKMCTFLFQNGALWEMWLVHCGINAISLCFILLIWIALIWCTWFYSPISFRVGSLIWSSQWYDWS